VAYTWSLREQVTRRKPNYQEFPPGYSPAATAPTAAGPAGYTTTTEETGRDVNWRAETADGLSGRITINGQTFDLTKGNVFLVSTAPGGGVTQSSRDFSGPQFSHEAFARVGEEG